MSLPWPGALLFAAFCNISCYSFWVSWVFMLCFLVGCWYAWLSSSTYKLNMPLDSLFLKRHHCFHYVFCLSIPDFLFYLLPYWCWTSNNQTCLHCHHLHLHYLSQSTGLCSFITRAIGCLYCLWIECPAFMWVPYYFMLSSVWLTVWYPASLEMPGCLALHENLHLASLCLNLIAKTPN